MYSYLINKISMKIQSFLLLSILISFCKWNKIVDISTIEKSVFKMPSVRKKILGGI